MQAIEVDTSRLTIAIKGRLKHPGRELDEIVNRSAYWIARNAVGHTPAVKVGTIDRELNVEIVPRMSKRGKLLPYSRRRRMLGSASGTATVHKGVPLAALIVQAQVVRPAVGSSPSTKAYNRLTNFRYARASSPFRGVPRAAGAAAMRLAVNRLIKGRRSSTHFLRAGWLNAISILRQFIGAAPPMDMPAANKRNADELGSATPAQPGWLVTATIWNNVGGAGANSSSHNFALQTYGAPALQRAVDEEADKMFAKCNEYIAREAEALNTAWR
jgi:hypothetical protein